MRTQSPWYLNNTDSNKENFRSISLLYVDAKILNKILTSQIQEHIKTIICHDQIGFTWGMQGWLNVWNSISVISYISKPKVKRLHDHLLKCWKSIWQNITPFHVKSLGENRNSWPIPKHNKSNINQIKSQYQIKQK